MNRKGVTLIELLAVLVILSIVFLITVNAVEKLAKNTDVEAYRISAKNYVKAAEGAISNLYVKTGKIEYGKYTVNGKKLISSDELKENISLNAKGDMPSNGVLCVDKDGKVAKYILKFGKYIVTKKEKDQTVKKGKDIDSSELICDRDPGFVAAIDIIVPTGIAKEKEVEIVDTKETDIPIQYKIGRKGTWTDYEGKFVVRENCTIYARLFDGEVEVAYTSREVSGIISYKIVTLDPNGGTVDIDRLEVFPGKQYRDELLTGSTEFTTRSLPIPTKSGSAFYGWYTDPVAGDEIKSTSTVMLKQDHTLYAHWATLKTSTLYSLTTSSTHSHSETRDYDYDHSASASVSSNSSTQGTFNTDDYLALVISMRSSSVSTSTTHTDSSCSNTRPSSLTITLQNTETGDTKVLSYSSANGTSYRLVFTDEEKAEYDVFSLSGVISGTSCSSSRYAWSSSASATPGYITVNVETIVDPEEENSTKELLYSLTSRATWEKTPSRDYDYDQSASVAIAKASSSPATEFATKDYLSYVLSISGSWVSASVDSKEDSRYGSSSFTMTLKNTKTGETKTKSYSNSQTYANQTKIKLTAEEREKYDVFTVSGTINAVSASASAYGWSASYSYKIGSIALYGLVPNS